MRQTIAVIGGGIAGLTAGYLLHQKYDLTLFEKSGRLGGNAYTVTDQDGQAIDIAACAFGRRSFKNTFKLFSKLNIKTVAPVEVNPLDAFGLGVSFYDLDTKKGLYITPGFKALFAQKFDILRPENIKNMLQVRAAVKRAKKILDASRLDGLTVEEAAKEMRLTDDARLIFLGSLCLISSMHCDELLNAPARFFIERLKKHDDLLPPRVFFSVRFPKNRTRSYVEALSAGYKEKVVLNSAIKAVVRRNNRIILLMADGTRPAFDKVIFACNADQALRLLDSPTAEEKRMLGAWRYTEGKIVVHTDLSHFPKKEFMNGYTFLYQKKGRYIETSISGSIWALPGISKKSDLVSTQHPNFPIQKDRVLFEKVLRTPIFDFNSCATIKDLPSLNGKNNTYYCGSHFGFGVHEDAITSAIEVAKELNVHF